MAAIAPLYRDPTTGQISTMKGGDTIPLLGSSSGYAIGTSGATVPLNNGSNTFSGTNTHSGPNTISSSLTISGPTTVSNSAWNWSSSGVRIGIGTATGADNMLQVIGTSSAIGFEVADAVGSARRKLGMTIDATAGYLDAYRLGTGAMPLLINLNGGNVLIGTTGTPNEKLDVGGNICPHTDNARTCGTASFRWSVVWAGTATISTSDRREKQDFAPINDAVLDAWTDVQALFFRWIAAVAEKGDAARIHAGWIAQDVQAVFEKHGLDPWRYALLCRDDIYENVKVKRVVQQRVTRPIKLAEIVVHGAVARIVERDDVEPVVALVPLFDAAGEPVFGPDGETVERVGQVLCEVPVFEDVEIEVEEQRHAGDRYGLRYEQCLVIEAAWLRRELARLNTKVAA